MRFWNQYSKVLKQAGEGDGSGGGETEENSQGSEGGGDSRNNEPELAEFKFGGNTYNIPRELAQGFGKLSAEYRTASSKLKTLEEAAKEEHPALKELQEKLQQLELEKLPEKEREAVRLGGEIKKLNGAIEAEKRNKVSPPNTERRDTQESLNRNVGKSRENRVFEGVLEGF
ncbi:Uncharacterized protein XB16_0936 [Leptospira santarosai]|uniref:Uncharacterized protein n=1 Tax=Leptospira santarosai TaxID=28183 RepID=A0A2P1QQU7_9LEPT|nr:Uncharacterized protein XB16_0936 [Leptospira santarosai]